MSDRDAVVLLDDRWQPGSPPTLHGSQCEDCGRLSFPPRTRCPACWSEEVARRPLSRTGHVYTATTVHVTDRSWLTAPFRLGYVDLEDGIRVLAHLVGDGADIGSRVELVQVEYGEDPIHILYGFQDEG